MNKREISTEMAIKILNDAQPFAMKSDYFYEQAIDMAISALQKLTHPDPRLITIATTYGYDAQSRQCIEEMAELTQAINKFWRKELDCGMADDVLITNPSSLRGDIIGEIADVQIVLDQLKILLACDGAVKLIIDSKLDRQIKRIESGE